MSKRLVKKKGRNGVEGGRGRGVSVRVGVAGTAREQKYKEQRRDDS